MVRKTVAFDEELVRDLSVLARKQQRDFSGAVRYALRIGLVAIENPELTVEEIDDRLLTPGRTQSTRTRLDILSPQQDPVFGKLERGFNVVLVANGDWA